MLTGAGVSAESGLRTFRASDGLWEDHKIEEVATPEGFARNPELVQRFYNERRRALARAQPNAAHLALAQFEARRAQGDDNFLLITQNIDDLHERAGSRRLCHMHGELLKMRCLQCGQSAPIAGDISAATACPHCAAAENCRPDIVWFGEIPYEMERIGAALKTCALFVSIGTSGNVYPAAGFAQLARHAGARCVLLNLEPTGGDFDEAIHGKATEIVPKFFAAL